MIGSTEMESTLHYTSVTHADAMMTSINKMRLNTDLCDVTVVVGNFRIMAHRIILSASAPFFYQTLQQSSSPHQQVLPPPALHASELHLDGVDVTAALKIIEFCYTSAISLDKDNVWPLLTASLKFELVEISSLCCEFLTTDLDLSNCLQVQRMSARLDYPQLSATASQFIQENIDKICASSALLSLPGTDLVDFACSLSASGHRRKTLVSLMTSWINFDPSGRASASRQLLQKLPEFEKELSALYPGGMEESACPSGDRTPEIIHKSKDGTSNSLRDGSCPVVSSAKVSPMGNRQSKEMNLPATTSADSFKIAAAAPQQMRVMSPTIPVHICVSCGDEFASERELRVHQQCCEESAHPVYPAEPLDGWEGQTGAATAGSDHTSCDMTGEGRSERVRGGHSSMDVAESSRSKKGYDGKTGSEEKLPSVDEESDSLSAVRDKSLSPGYSIERDGSERVAAMGSSRDDQIMSQNDTNNNDINEEGRRKNADDPDCEETVDVVNEDCDPLAGNVRGEGHESRPALDVEHVGAERGPSSAASWDEAANDLGASSCHSMLSYKCQICYKSFPDRKGLSKHWKQTHGVDQGLAAGADHSQVYHQLSATHSTGEQNQKFANGKRHRVAGTSLAEEDGVVNRSSQQFVPEGVNGSVETSELFQQYMRQYQEFTKWCLEQGPTFCQLCLLYHPKGSVCPKAATMSKEHGGRRHKAPGQPDVVQGLYDHDSGLGVGAYPSTDYTPIKSDPGADSEEPLDMSKSSQEFVSPRYPESLSTTRPARPDIMPPTSSSSSSSPLDLSQYYQNYARLLAGDTSIDGQVEAASRLGSMDVNSEAVRSMYSPFLSYPATISSSANTTGYHALSLVQGNPSLPALTAGQPPTVNSSNKFHGPANTDVSSEGKASRQNSSSGTSQTSSGQRPGPRRRLTSRQGFPCTVCTRVFSYQAALFTHMRTHSPTARVYQCQLCNESFARAPDLKVHVCPNGVEKPYNCPSCGQTFAKNIHLKRHLATHSGLKPYPCWVCGKRFSRSDHLKRHTQSIHAGSRPHACHVCGKEFVRKYELNKHMLMHTAPGGIGSEVVGQEVVGTEAT